MLNKNVYSIFHGGVGCFEVTKVSCFYPFWGGGHVWVREVVWDVLIKKSHQVDDNLQQVFVVELHPFYLCYPLKKGLEVHKYSVQLLTLMHEGFMSLVLHYQLQQSASLVFVRHKNISRFKVLNGILSPLLHWLSWKCLLARKGKRVCKWFSCVRSHRKKRRNKKSCKVLRKLFYCRCDRVRNQNKR